MSITYSVFVGSVYSIVAAISFVMFVIALASNEKHMAKYYFFIPPFAVYHFCKYFVFRVKTA